MKYPNNKKNSRGVSIIEIVVSMVLLMAVMFSLAFVYPNGRRLTNSSDYRTKATEIARSILEETKLVDFDSSTTPKDGTLASLVLVKKTDELSNNNIISLDDALKKSGRDFQWPYHHLSTLNVTNLTYGTTWDATATASSTSDAKPICPFFITNTLPNAGTFLHQPNRPFFLLNQDVNAEGNNYAKSIQVSPIGEVTVGGNDEVHPTFLVINVIVYWVDRKANNFVINYINLCDSRTYNAY